MNDARQPSEVFDKDVIFGPPRHRKAGSECSRCGKPWPCPDASGPEVER